MTAYDVVVIGSGVAGYSAAIRLAQLGARVCIVEKDRIGGTCLNRGCIPTKALLSSVALLSSIKRAGEFGINVGEVSFDFSKMIERKNSIVNDLVKGVEYLIKNNEVELIKGNARMRSLNAVEVTGSDEKKELNAKYIIIATGSEPARPKWIRFDNQVITSDEILNLKSPPKSIMIIGGGAIGCEFASLFNALGTKVSLVEIMPQILPGEDDDITERLTHLMTKNGVMIYTRVKIEELFTKTRIMIGKLSTGEQMTAEKVLVATGRIASSRNIGLEKIAIKTEQGKILVNDKLQTNVPNIYAVGDVVRGPMYAHKASMDGVVAAENIMGKDARIDYNSVPSCIFTIPEVASVGMIEKDAAKKHQITVGKFMFRANGRAQTLNDAEGFVKIVGEVDTGKILGVHIIGRQATELINTVSLAMRNNLTVSDLINTIFAHPTLSECIKEAAGDIKGETIYKISKF